VFTLYTKYPAAHRKDPSNVASGMVYRNQFPKGRDYGKNIRMGNERSKIQDYFEEIETVKKYNGI